MHKERIDGDLIFVVHDFLTPAECQSFIKWSEREGYDEATITTMFGAVMDKGVRDNSRFMIDVPDLADQLWQRARPFIAERDDDWRAVGLNERFRFYRYDPTQKFALHYDGFFRRDDGDQSQLTFMVYLNDEFQGGETRFYDENRELHVSVRPQRGKALVFAHRQLHEGAPVIEGRKYVLRTDVMYTIGAPAGDTTASRSGV